MMTQPPFRSRNTLFNEPSFITNTPNFNDSCSNSDNNHKPMHYSSTNVSIATQCVSRIFSRNQSSPAGHVLFGSATQTATKVVQSTHNTKNTTHPPLHTHTHPIPPTRPYTHTHTAMHTPHMS